MKESLDKETVARYLKKEESSNDGAIVAIYFLTKQIIENNERISELKATIVRLGKDSIETNPGFEYVYNFAIKSCLKDIESLEELNIELIRIKESASEMDIKRMEKHYEFTQEEA